MIFAVSQVAMGGSVYATADNGATNLFGTLDLPTGVFTTIAAIPSVNYFTALTSGTGGVLHSAGSTCHLYTISSSGALSQPSAVQ